ncbi:carboxylesterase [Aquincola sp. J276]|uniref:alpha/beta hydrolase n=1 Tax=Aquincola sp. J276 TaxID=2898432 RepID=UPI002150B5DB|nr:alpha/beta fold hydrolase [Aquincola sp. J276]MCR5868617.1 alpha/beta fold hydrolase [Aquincola sp. J276]
MSWTSTALLVAVALLQACAVPSARHQASLAFPPVLWLDNAGQEITFPQYKARAAQHIHDFHGSSKELSPDRRKTVVESIAPAEWFAKGKHCSSLNTDGVLLVHGLTDSPFLMRDLAEALAAKPLLPNRCLIARSLLLDGHGTVPGDLLQVDYQNWVHTVSWGIRSFVGQAQDVHLVGFSTGGALGLLLAHRTAASTLRPRLKSLVLISPAIRLLDERAQSPEALGMLAFSGVKPWLERYEDRDYAKYESFALNGVYQVSRLSQQLARHESEPLSLPVFMALSLNDQTIDSRAAIQRFVRLAETGNALWLAAPRGASNADPIVQDVLRATGHQVSVVDSRIETERIDDFSHVALPVAPANVHYGRRGDYVNCLSYAAIDTGLWCACWGEDLGHRPAPPACPKPDADRVIVYGEPPPRRQDVTAPVQRRLTFNPWFAEMVEAIRSFLSSIAEPTP